MPASQYAQTTDWGLAINSAAISSLSVGDQNAALQAGSAVVDSYISSRFVLPLSSWGVDVKLATVRIAALVAMSDRGWTPGAEDAQIVTDGHDKAISWLRDVSKGIASPTGIVDSAPVQTAPVPENAPFVIAATQGSIGTTAGSAFNGDCSSPLPVGTPGPAKPRGW